MSMCLFVSVGGGVSIRPQRDKMLKSMTTFFCTCISANLNSEDQRTLQKDIAESKYI